MKNWIKAITTVAGTFLALILFHVVWPTKMGLTPNDQYISAVRDEDQNILAVFGEKTILDNRLGKTEMEKLNAKGMLNKFPIVPITAYDELPQNYVYFLTKVENKNFFTFGKDNIYGLSVSGLARLLRGKADGGSNIPQQLLKNIIHKKEGMGTIYLSRKYGEQLASFQMYKAATPEEILLAYTNYAGNFWYEQDFSGLVLASYAIFNRPPVQLNDLEMLLTVKTLKSGRELRELCDDKRANRELIKEKMLDYFEQIADGSESDRNRLKAMRQMDLGFSDRNDLRKTTALTHFLKSRSLGNGQRSALQYTSSISSHHQQSLAEAVGEFRKKFRKFQLVKGYSLEFAVLAIDVKTGLIEATFGNSKNNGATMNFTDYGNGFQCGSVLKPLVFLELFENHGFDENSRLYNGNLSQFSYNPTNTNDKLLRKAVLTRDIFKYSLNKAAVNHRVLADPIAVAEKVEESLAAMDISANPTYNLSESYVLGTRTMTPLELAQAYQMVFNEGTMKSLTPWKYVTNPHSLDTVFNYRANLGKAIYGKAHVNRIRNLLPAAFEPGGTCHRLLKFLPKDRPYFGKTGTTGKAVDGWTVLSDGQKLIVAWTGYLKNENGILTSRNAPSIPTKSGGGSAGVLAAMVYSKLYK